MPAAAMEGEGSGGDQPAPRTDSREQAGSADESQQPSATSSRAKSRGSPRKSNSRASMRSRTTPPPKLRRRQSKENDASGSDSEPPHSQTTPAAVMNGSKHCEENKPTPDSVGITEETPSAVKLLDDALTVDGVKGRATPVKSEGQASNKAASNGRSGSRTGGRVTPGEGEAPRSVTPTPRQPAPRSGGASPPPAATPGRNDAHSPISTSPSPTQTAGHSPSSAWDALPSSPTRSRVSASAADPIPMSSRAQTHRPGDPQATGGFSPSRTRVQVQTHPPSRPSRGAMSVEATKTMSQTLKERPLVQKAHSKRFEPPPSPEPDDSLSETKTAVIRRVQDQLQQWEKQLDHIQIGRVQSDKTHKHELHRREALIRELKVQNDETERQRKVLDEERARLAEQLLVTSDDLVDKEGMLEQAHEQLKEYEATCQELEDQRGNLETEVAQLDDELQQNEALRKRLNEQVTQLQGQLAIEEQRSRFCMIL